MASTTLSPAVSSSQPSQKFALVCNECGKKRTVSENGQFNDRCPKCGGVDWDVVGATPSRRTPVHPQLQPSHQGNTITDLEKMVENCIVSGPHMSLAQLRILLRVEQACENCEATGMIESRGLSPEISADRCGVCRGKGYVIPEREESAVQQ